MNKIPIVAIVGAPNAGKSSLFNKLIGQRQAIVYDQPGTTRDRVQNILTYKNKSVWLVDTAGIEKANDQIEDDVQTQVTEAIDVADLIIFAIDAKSVVDQSLQRVAKTLHKSSKPVIVSVNKIDTNRGEIQSDIKKLGLKNIIGTSVTQSQGIEELLKLIFSSLPKAKGVQAEKTVALVGRPNVGKSSIFNTILGSSKAVVSDQPGTTRDVNREIIKYHTKTYQLLDTAGLRRKSQAKDIERISWLRTIEAIDEADVVILVVDATEPSVHADQRIAGFVKEAGKGLVVAINKWDQLKHEEGAQASLETRLQHDFGFAWWAPLVLTSAISGHNVKKLLQVASTIITRRETKFKTAALNNNLQMAMAKHPPAGLKNRHPKLNYATQTDINPPTITLFGKHLDFLHWSYQRYLENCIREEFDLIGTPITLELREKN